MRYLPTLLLFLSGFGCQQPHDADQTQREKLLNNYLALVDSSQKVDTADLSFKVIKAYHSNDTSSIAALDTFILAQQHRRENWDVWPGDMPLPRLNELHVPAAFRFIFSLYDSPAYEVITVTAFDTVYQLHYVYWVRDHDSRVGSKQKEFEKSISKGDWRDLMAKLHAADFWGLKNDNNVRGNDGNDLTVMGYQQSGSTTRMHVVHRWTNTTLNDPFYFIYYHLLEKTERRFVTE